MRKIYELCRGMRSSPRRWAKTRCGTAQYFAFDRPRSLLTSGGLGTMGYGLPAALGAQVACPDRLVVDIAGDGSIQMNIQELITAVNYKLP